ncbi:hypothetical protein JAAARDRAFT_142149, partial [Jaapia argillacea MUCL 33604]
MLKLTADGSNWLTYKTQFTTAADACGILGYFNRTTSRPVAPTPAGAAGTATSVPKADQEALNAHVIALKAWETLEKKSCQLLISTIGNGLLMKVQHKPTVAEMWATVVKLYNKKTEMVVVDTELHMKNLKCADDGDVRSHLDELLLFQEKLANARKVSEDKD